MKKFQFTFTGFMPLLMHADDIDGADMLEAWRKDPNNKGVTKAGDDRSPPWTWHTYLYRHDGFIAMPAENVMVALRQAGAQITLKGQKSFKEATQSGLLITEPACEFRNNGERIKLADIDAMHDKPYVEQKAACEKLGFELFAKRASLKSSKNIRVRPRFHKWTVSGEVMVLKPEITNEILQRLFTLAGKAGLGDWRPSSKTPGWHGQADVTVQEIV